MGWWHKATSEEKENRSTSRSKASLKNSPTHSTKVCKCSKETSLTRKGIKVEKENWKDNKKTGYQITWIN